jgi:pimeloyl-ACP methyl ester carboxylesterase
LSADTKVVVAHSLGTVIAYQVLCTRPDLQVDLITLGSPLGDPSTVFPLLQPAPVDGKGVWPVGVRRWTNVAAEGDLATAACPRLADAFGDRVEDHLVFNGRHAHDAEPYLNSLPTGRALADALGLPRRG